MNYKVNLMIPKSEKEHIHFLENSKGKEIYDKYGFKEDETISETVTFENGFEADIKLVIADEENYSWTEAVLFDKKGNQISFTEPSDYFFGEWYLEDNDGNEYIVNVIGED